MTKQIKALIKLELCNLYGLNVLRFSHDKRVRGRSVLMIAIWAFLLLLLAVYTGMLSYGLIFMGLEEVVPAYLVVLSSIFPFLLNILTAGTMLFRQEGYDMLCSLPTARGVIVLSRFARLYVEHLLLTLAVLLPGLAVYLWDVRPEPICCLFFFLGIWFVPFLPMTAAAFLGTLVAGLASRMRHKSLAVSGLTILVVFVVLYGSSRLAAVEGTITEEMLRELSTWVFALLGKVYPPAVWFGRAVREGDVAWWLLYMGSGSLALLAAAALVTLCFHSIYQRLYGSLARHDYRMGRLQESSVLAALCKREFRRYFSSSVYVSNTIIGPVMGCILSGVLLAAGTEVLEGALPTAVSFEWPDLIPFFLAAVFGMMPTTAVTISMEGKYWWLIKSLPLPFRTVLNAKLLMNLLLAAPFYLAAELLTVLALRPAPLELFWLLLVPLLFLVFSSVYGLAINLHFPVFDWENEVTVVKQSVSSMLGGLGGLVAAILCVAAVAVSPEGYTDWVKAGLCVLLLVLTGWLYRRSCRYTGGEFGN